MAKSTVYPYGPGGQMPSSIPIADDLNTNRADVALSAKQGVILGNGLEGLKDLGEKCLIEIPQFIETDISDSFAIGSTNPDGSIAPSVKTRAYYRFRTDAYKISVNGLSQGWYMAVHLCNSNYAIQVNLNWLDDLSDIDLQGYEYVQLVLKYGSAGKTTITQSMLNALECELVEYLVSGDSYAPAAPFSLVDDINKELDGSNYDVEKSTFVNGTIDTNGSVISNATRLVTQDLIDAPAGSEIQVTPNGQKWEIAYYSAAGTYEGAAGWETGEGDITFAEAKKVRFLVAKTNNANISVSELAVQIKVISDLGLKKRVENLEAGGGGSATTKGNDSFNVMNKTVILLNPYKDRPQNAYKGQLHCHTNNSDGADSPATVVGKYVAAGYDFMTITDHNYVTPEPGVSGIVWLGDSYEDTHNSAGYQHMNVFNADAVYNKQSMYQTSNTPQMIVDHFVKNGDSVVSYNHPEYPPVYISDSGLAALPKGISFVEVFNGTIQTLIGTVASASQLPAAAYYGDMYDCTGDGKRYKNTSTTYASPTWTATNPTESPDGNLDRGFRLMLDNGHKVFCNAVDDYHRGDNMFNRGWVVAFANEATKSSIWNALLNGCSYASTGVELTDIQVKDGLFSLQIANGGSAVTTFYGYGNEVLATINGANPSYQINGSEKYVRAMVQIGRNKAWTQPVWIVGVKNQYDF